MGETGAALEIAAGALGEGGTRVRAHGAWTFRALDERRSELAHQLAALEQRGLAAVRWDLNGITSLDDAGAVWLARAVRQAAAIEVAPRHQELLRQASEGLLVPREPKHPFDPLWGVVGLGAAGLNLAVHLRDGVVMLGQLVLD